MLWERDRVEIQLIALSPVRVKIRLNALSPMPHGYVVIVLGCQKKPTLQVVTG